MGLGALVGGVGGAILGGPTGAAVGASIGGGLDASSAQSSANRQNRKLSNKQMAFQERMSSTAHQRQVDDLKAAGLNPMLSANTGATSPGGSMATMQNEEEHMQGAISTAMQAKTLTQDLRNLKAQEGSTKSQDKLNQVNAQVSANNAKVSKAQEQKIKTETTLLKANEPLARVKNQAGQLAEKLLNNLSSSAKKVQKTYKKGKKRMPNKANKILNKQYKLY